MQITDVTVEPGGWVRFDNLDVRVRFHFNAVDLRAEPMGVEFLDGVLTARRLSGVPFGRIEVVANSFDIRNTISFSLDGRWPDQQTEPPSLPHEMKVTDAGGGKSLDDVYAMLLELDEHTSGFSGRHSTEFYKLIAAAYYRHAVNSDSPGLDIAVRLKAPVANVWRWVRVCRSKGYLPPARAGKS